MCQPGSGARQRRGRAGQGGHLPAEHTSVMLRRRRRAVRRGAQQLPYQQQQQQRGGSSSRAPDFMLNKRSP